MFTFLKRQALLSFETMFAFFCLYSGMSALAGIGISKELLVPILGYNLWVLTNLGLTSAGLTTFIGTGSGLRHIEACGLITTLAALTLNSTVYMLAYGPHPLLINNLVYTAAAAVACFMRLKQLVNLKTLVIIPPDGHQ
jgi:hypothetical protein